MCRQGDFKTIPTTGADQVLLPANEARVGVFISSWAASTAIGFGRVLASGSDGIRVSSTINVYLTKYPGNDGGVVIGDLITQEIHAFAAAAATVSLIEILEVGGQHNLGKWKDD